jgi:hypothetical protein
MSEVPSTTVAREDLFGLAAEFTTTPGIYHAAEKTRAAGYTWFDCNVGGLTGLILACILQVFTNSLQIDLWALVPVVGYQFEVSGKPLIGPAAFVPVAFEMTVLFSALTAVFGTFFLNKLPMFYHPVLKCPQLARATDDRFYLVIEAKDPKFSLAEVEAFLHTLEPESVIALEK